MIAIIDNYDSFTYNIYQMLGEFGANVKVFRNDAVTCKELGQLKPEKIIISPGPGFPDTAGISMQVVKEFYRQIPILGICLGHQSIVQAFGGKIIHAPHVMHGKVSLLNVRKIGPLFHGVSESPRVGRYHSLVADPAGFPDELEITSVAEDDLIMSVSHRNFPVHGIQFHPESILTPEGAVMLKNFLKIEKQGRYPDAKAINR